MRTLSQRQDEPVRSSDILPRQNQGSLVRPRRAGKLILTLFWDCTGPVLETSYAQRNYNQQRGILWSVWEKLGTCNQVKTSRFTQFWCVYCAQPHTAHATTQQNYESEFGVSSTWYIFTRLSAIRLSWTPHGGAKWEEIHCEQEIKEAMHGWLRGPKFRHQWSCDRPAVNAHE